MWCTPPPYRHSPCHSTQAVSNGSAWVAVVFKHVQPKVPLWLMPGGKIRSASPPSPPPQNPRPSKMPDLPCNSPLEFTVLSLTGTSTPCVGACRCSAVAPAAVIRPNTVSPFAPAARAQPPSSQGCGRCGAFPSKPSGSRARVQALTSSSPEAVRAFSPVGPASRV